MEICGFFQTRVTTNALFVSMLSGLYRDLRGFSNSIESRLMLCSFRCYSGLYRDLRGFSNEIHDYVLFVTVLFGVVWRSARIFKRDS